MVRALPRERTVTATTARRVAEPRSERRRRAAMRRRTVTEPVPAARIARAVPHVAVPQSSLALTEAPRGARTRTRSEPLRTLARELSVTDASTAAAGLAARGVAARVPVAAVRDGAWTGAATGAAGVAGRP